MIPDDQKNNNYTTQTHENEVQQAIKCQIYTIHLFRLVFFTAGNLAHLHRMEVNVNRLKMPSVAVKRIKHERKL